MTSQPLLPGAADAVTRSLQQLLSQLRQEDYCFVTPTPLTLQRRYAPRAAAGARPGRLDDVFGWNLPFTADAVPPVVLALMEAGELLVSAGNGRWRSRLRVSGIGGELFWHSGFPTDAPDAVFFGPDTYRFVNFVCAHLPAQPASAPLADAALPRVLDVGCGSGAGGVIAAQCLGGARLVLSDINPAALRLAAINATVAGVPATLALGDALAATRGDMDVILCNPPYLVDATARTYRHGGGRLGRALSVRIATEALARLAPGGRLLLYTGVAIVDGRDLFLEEMTPLLERSGCAWAYDEIDPDVFGEELAGAAYRDVDRIAAVGLVAVRRAP